MMNMEIPRPAAEAHEKSDWLPKKRYLKLASGWKPAGFVSEEEYRQSGFDPKNYRQGETLYREVFLDSRYDDRYLGLEEDTRSAEGSLQVGFSEGRKNDGTYEARKATAVSQQRKLEDLSRVPPAEREEFEHLYDELLALRVHLDSSASYSRHQDSFRELRVQLRDAIEQALEHMKQKVD